MRVGLSIVTDSPGGAETMVLGLAAELQGMGHEIVAFGPPGADGWLTQRFSRLGVARVPVSLPGAFRVGGAVRFASLIREHELDVLHSHEFTMAVWGALGSGLAGCRHVITMHGGMYHATRFVRRGALRIAMELSDHTIAVSESFRGRLASSIGVPRRAIRVVHNGVRPSFADEGGVIHGRSARATDVREELRAELGAVGGAPFLLAVGNLLEVKGHAHLVEAMALLGDRDRPAVLGIAGSGEEEDDLRGRIEALGLADRVRLLGYRSDVPDLLAACDIFVMPSLSEGLPMAMIEAMLASKSIVASEVGGIPELIPSADFGRLVEAGDPQALAEWLEELLGDEGLRGRLGRRARERATRLFTASAMAERYLELYSD
jgi:glycosyltransferase involved in cell wall biosynthesis